MKSKQVVIAKFDKALDAAMAQKYLAAVGIAASMLKDDDGGMFPSLQQTEGVQLMVAEAQKEKAKAILAARP